jgi:hypothetical protein
VLVPPVEISDAPVPTLIPFSPELIVEKFEATSKGNHLSPMK